MPSCLPHYTLCGVPWCSLAGLLPRTASRGTRVRRGVRGFATEGVSRYGDVLRGKGGDVSSLLRAEGSPENPLTLLKDVTRMRWPPLADQQVALLLRDLAKRQQRHTASARSALPLESTPCVHPAPREGHSHPRKLSYSARELFERAKSLGHTLGVLSYTQLIVCFANSGNAVLADQYFVEMKAAGISPTVFTYTALANSHSQIANALKLREVVNDMNLHMQCSEEGGQGGVPAAGTSQAAVESSVRDIRKVLLTSIAAEDSSNVWKTYREAEDLFQGEGHPGTGVAPRSTPVVAVSVLEATAEAAALTNETVDVSSCIKLFIHMKDNGLVVTLPIYHALLAACLAAKAPTETEGVLMMMREDHLSPTHETLTKVLMVHSAVGEPTAVALCLKRFPPGSVDDPLVGIAVGGVLARLQADAARILQDRAAARVAASVVHSIVEEFKPTSCAVLSAALQVFCTAGAAEYAERAIARLRVHGHTPDPEDLRLFERCLRGDSRPLYDVTATVIEAFSLPTPGM